jgi:hypothetical protein
MGIKSRVGRFILQPEFQSSLLGAGLRSFVRWSHRWVGYSPNFRLDMQALERPHYAYCMMGAAKLARSLGHERISALEFGVAGGNGLKFMVDFAEDVRKATGVTIECYGLDTGCGMPPPEGNLDLPYWFREAQYRMDEPKLRKRLPEAKLVIGPIRETIDNFIATMRPAPIGAIFFDMDYFSSTRDGFRLFSDVREYDNHFLPRIFSYFDDILGSEREMYGPFNGQLAAIHEFNEQRANEKIHLNQNLIHQGHIKYGYQIYYIHLFSHSDYARYIGDDGQEDIEAALQLST